jgi:hypothetical protein
MNIFNELFVKKFYGNFRAKIIEVDSEIKNGRYKVRVYPMMAKIAEDKLPYALSNMTNSFKHLSLKVGQWTWCFFENGNARFPIIFDLNNIKDNYPDSAKGNSPSWFNNISANTNIDESTVNYNGEYGKTDDFDFGDIHIHFDEENKQVIIMVGSKYFAIDTNGDIHEKVNNKFINVSQKFNTIAQSFKFLTTMAEEISIDNTGKVTIKGGASQMIIKNSLTSLKDLLSDIITAFSTQIETGNLGLPTVWNSNPKMVEALVKLNLLLTNS